LFAGAINRDPFYDGARPPEAGQGDSRCPGPSPWRSRNGGPCAVGSAL